MPNVHKVDGRKCIPMRETKVINRKWTIYEEVHRKKEKPESKLLISLEDQNTVGFNCIFKIPQAQMMWKVPNWLNDVMIFVMMAFNLTFVFFI